ncbi:MAG: J domain-containing protein [Ignavibacteriales bacterium]
MGDISKLRDAADLLLNSGRYDEAYDVYDEIYCQIWSALANVQNGLSEFSFSFLTHNIRQAMDFKTHFIEPAVNTIFLKWFNLDIDQTLNEFIFTIYGHLQCICFSKYLIDKISSETVITEFLVLYNLIIHETDDKWITHLLRLVTPVSDGIRLKKLRPNMAVPAATKMLIQSAEKINATDWSSLNTVILEYLNKSNESGSDLFISIQNVAGTRPGQWHKHQRKQEKKEKYEKYERYEKYEKYEKYENSSYEQKEEPRQEPKGNQGRREFDINSSTEEEKVRYFGSVLGLKGRVTKSHIRKRYLEEMARYHPDKVANLGEELIELAERKTKEINAAYDWLKIKFNL